MLAASHRYQLARLQLWCEDRLASLVCAETVCDVVCQARACDVTRGLGARPRGVRRLDLGLLARSSVLPSASASSVLVFRSALLCELSAPPLHPHAKRQVQTNQTPSAHHHRSPQAHLYDAKQLEGACLQFIGERMPQVCVTPSFGALSAAWPAVLVKINHHLAGVPAAAAAPAIEAAAAARRGSKRKREQDDGGAARAAVAAAGEADDDEE